MYLAHCMPALFTKCLNSWNSALHVAKVKALQFLWLLFYIRELHTVYIFYIVMHPVYLLHTAKSTYTIKSHVLSHCDAFDRY